MKRLRVAGWSRQLLSPRTRPCCPRQHELHQRIVASERMQSTSASSEPSSADLEYLEKDISREEVSSQIRPPAAPSPRPEAALQSAKLAALHARLSLPKKLPLQTLGRTLVDTSADPDVDFNNASMSQIGSHLISYQVSEWLLCTYPRLPTSVLFSAMNAYTGPPTLHKIGREWGVETAAAPGQEVDPGLLQYTSSIRGAGQGTGASTRPDPFSNYRRGMSSRIVYDDECGDTIQEATADDSRPTSQAMAKFVRAVVGAVYLHAGREAAKTFIKAHILSRHLDISKLFEFKQATRDLSRLCARENFSPPVARLLSETGRLSRTPVYVVGIFCGLDKLGEGVGPSLVEARYRAAISSLKAWYMYSPNAGSPSQLPSDVEGATGDKNGRKKGFEPVHIDIGEIV